MFFLSSLLIALLFATSAQLASAEPCEAEPTSNSVTQLTNKGSNACTCCEQFQTFLDKNEYVYTLFYSGAGANRITTDILWKFNHLYQDWKHTKVAFGQIDVNMDHELQTQWLEPGQVPTNILFHKGQPVRVATEDFQLMLKKYQGSSEGSKWLLSKYFGADKLATNLHYAQEIASPKKFRKQIDPEIDHSKASSKPKIVRWKAVGFFPLLSDQEKTVGSFREAVWNFNHPPAGTRPADHKPVAVHFTYSDKVTEEAGLASLLDSQKEVRRKNRDGRSVLRLYGLEADSKKFGYMGIEIDYMELHQDKWVSETMRMLKEKGDFSAKKKEEL